MRVIGGEFRGRRLKAPEGIATRPTSDRVRESLFNIIAGRVRGSTFLDAYAGTGAVGIEALSRGARACVFVENARAAAQVLQANLELLGCGGRAELIIEPFAGAAARLARAAKAFDLVFLDPPYGAGELLRAVRLSAARGLVAAGGLVIAEHDAEIELPPSEGPLRLARTVRYGGTCLSFLEPGVDSAGSGP